VKIISRDKHSCLIVQVVNGKEQKVLSHCYQALRVESEKKLAELNHRLEIEAHKLEDCQREIDNYRSHFEENTAMVSIA